MIAPFFDPVAPSRSARSGSRAALISSAAVATDSVSRGVSAVVPRRRLADEVADFLPSSMVIAWAS